MTNERIFNGMIVEECFLCPLRLNYTCRHPESPSEMGRRKIMTWICDERGKAIFPNDCPLETTIGRDMPSKEDIEELKEILNEIGE